MVRSVKVRALLATLTCAASMSATDPFNPYQLDDCRNETAPE